MAFLKRVLLCDHCPDFFIEELVILGFNVDDRQHIENDELMTLEDVYEVILIKSSLHLNAQFFSRFNRIKTVLRPGSGLDNVDVAYCQKNRIDIINSPNGNSNAVGEHALGLLLMMTNHLFRAVSQVRNHEWIREENRGVEVENMSIGVIGVGNAGSAFCKKLEGLRPTILPHDKYKPFIDSIGRPSVELDEVFRHADVVSLHLPLNKETRYYVNDDFFKKLRKPIYFINCSRGKVLDTKSLLKAINEGKVYQAALDVIETEPFSAGSQEEQSLLDQLMDTGKVIITPHIAGWTVEAKNKMFQILLDKYKAVS